MKKLFFILLCFMPFAANADANPADNVVRVEINKGQMVKFSRPAASVVIADPTTADIQVVSPSMVFVYGKKIGETSLTAVDAKDAAIFNGIIDVSHNLSSLESNIKRVAPKAHVNFKTVDGGLLIDGSASSVQEAENIRNLAAAFVGDKDKVINMMTTAGGDQVMLKVKIVEMARTDLKNLGVNLSASVTSGGGIVSQVVNGPLAASTLVSRATGADGNIQATMTRGKNSISGLIDALETDGLATVLAEPSLTTTTGKAASFLAGGQFPIPVPTSTGTGGTTVTVQYEPYGVSLNFTPVVMANDRISILVNPEVSSLDFSSPIQNASFTYPIINTRKAQSTVELGSGQTFVMAGLLSSNTSNDVNKFPGIGDLPVLGELFRSQKFQNNQTELVILVTPYIVHPISNHKKVQTPLDGFKPPTDMQRNALGSLYQQQDMPDKKEVKE